METLNEDYETHYIFHLSDIHIRLYHRLDDEYDHVFRQMYGLLDESKAKGEKCLIVLTGDILHNKNELSPECILTTLKFLNTLSQYYPTLFIAGNHDTLLNNLNRIDSLSAILAENKNENLHYLRNSGWYRYGNVVFGVSSLLDDKMTLAKDFVWEHKDGPEPKKIALYHGGVGKFRTNKGFVMEGVPTSTFDGYDMVMLGDIHLHQYLDKQKRIAYAGSMISQNFGETDPNHGVLKWDARTHTSSLIVLDNPYRYCEAVLNGGCLLMDGQKKEIDDTLLLPERCRLKVVIHEKKTATDIGAIAFIRNKHPLIHTQEHVEMVPQAATNSQSPRNNNFLSIIQDYFSSLPHEWGDRDEVLGIVMDYFKDNLDVKTEASHFEILELEFHYMFGYGPNNRIDFSKFHRHQTVGIFGMNSAGKSTLIDIILFLMYGCITRYKHSNSVPPEVVHFQQKKSSGMIRFRSHNITYEIQKKMSRGSNSKIKVEEKLFRINADGTRTDMSEEHRKKTDKFVISQIGTPTQFLFTNVFLQTNEQSFRSLTPKDRKDFLYDILQMSQLEEHYQKSLGKWKDNKGVLDQLEKDLKSLVVSAKQIAEAYEQLCRLKEERSSHEEKLKSIQKQVREKLSGKKPCPISLDEIQEKERVVRDKIKKFQGELETIQKFCSGQGADTDFEALGEIRKNLSEAIEDLCKKIRPMPSTDALDFRFDNQHKGPTFDDVVCFRHDAYAEFMEEYNKQSQEPTPDEAELVAKKEQLLSSLYPEPETGTEDIRSLQWNMEKKLKMSHEDVKKELATHTHTLFVMESELSSLTETWGNKWAEWEKVQKEPDTFRFATELVFNAKCGSCCANKSVLHSCMVEAEAFAQKQKDLWDEVSDSIERSSHLKQEIAKERKVVMDLQEQERISADITRIQRLIDNRKIRERIGEIQKDIQTSRRLRDQKQDFERMKLMWEKTEKIFKERQQTEGTNKKIEKEIQKTKKKVAELDQIIHTRSRLKELCMVLEREGNRLEELEQWKANRQENDDIDRWVREKESEEQKLRSLMDLSIDAYIKKKQEHDVLEMQAQTKKIKEEEYNRVKAENGLLSHLLEVLHRDGLPMYFLERHLPMIEDRINDLIAPFLKDKKIVLRKEQKKESVNILLSVSTQGSETNYMGGMEGFIVDASIKEVLAEVSLQCKSNLFIIDEGISALDKKHMENLDQFFHFLEERHPHVFIISHLNEAQNIVRHSLQISKDGDNYSKIECV